MDATAAGFAPDVEQTEPPSSCGMATVADPDENSALLRRRSEGTYGRRGPIPEDL